MTIPTSNATATSTPNPVTTDDDHPKWKIVLTALGLVLAAGALVTVTINSSNSNTVNGDGNNTVICNGCDAVLDDASRPDDEVAEYFAEEYADVPPPSDGPYQYGVVGTGELGLFVRTSPEPEGFPVGVLPDRTTAWVECQLTNTFVADSTMPDPGRWLRVHAPTSHERSTSHTTSSPGDPAENWIYAAFTVPMGHNGKIPTC